MWIYNYGAVLLYSDRYEYLWEDGVKYKRPTKLPAPEYVDALMNWAQNILDDENVFPNKIGMLWPHLGQCQSSPHFTTRCTLPQDFPRHSPDDRPPTVPCVRPYL